MDKKVIRSIVRRSFTRSYKEIKALLKAGRLEKVDDRLFYHLSDHECGAFIPVVDIPNLPFYKGGEPSYGGAQVWWSNQSYKNSTGNNYGCGVIAATNLVFYLAKNFKVYKSLLTRKMNEDLDGNGGISYENYMKIADELWSDLRPYCGIDGLNYYSGRDPYTVAYPLGFGVTVAKLTKGLQAYAERKGIDLRFDKIKARYASDQQGVAYIKNNLRNNNPVLLLSLRNGIKEFEFHWVMITELYENQEEGVDRISIASWGDRKSMVDFNLLWNFGLFMENQYMISVVNV